MATVTIDGREYDRDKLSDEARQQLNNISMVDLEIRRLQMQLAIHNTARGAYSAKLSQLLPKSDQPSGQ